MAAALVARTLTGTLSSVVWPAQQRAPPSRSPGLADERQVFGESMLPAAGRFWSGPASPCTCACYAWHAQFLGLSRDREKPALKKEIEEWRAGRPGRRALKPAPNGLTSGARGRRLSTRTTSGGQGDAGGFRMHRRAVWLRQNGAFSSRLFASAAPRAVDGAPPVACRRTVHAQLVHHTSVGWNTKNRLLAAA